MTARSRRIAHVAELLQPIFRFDSQSRYATRVGQPGISDFVFGNPHELPLAAFADALSRWSTPQRPDWYAYKGSEPAARALVAATLRQRYELPFEDDDIFMTNGAFAALAVMLAALVDPGDEVIFLSPPWFFYESLIAASGAEPVRVRLEPPDFGLPVDAIDAALTERTRAIIVNTPHNPTGNIYSRAELDELARILTAAGDRWGRPIYLLSDEAYNRIVFDNHSFHSPAQSYPFACVLYTYGKTLLTPGQRIGYIALPPTMPEREPLREAIFLSQLISGYAFPNALLQHALSDIEQLSIDLAHLQHKRDWMVDELRAVGYEVRRPAGTFYLLPRAPWPDDNACVAWLAERDVFCLPGSVVEAPGYFRISLTANDTMIERALPIFAALQDASVTRS